jgi:hypothetical protein
MKVTIEDFQVGGGWYLKINGQTVAVLLGDNIREIVNTYGSPRGKKITDAAITEHYAR